MARVGRRRLWAGVVLLACVGLGLAMLQLAFARWLPLGQILQRWGADLGIELRVESARARLFPRPAVVLEGLAVDPGIEIAHAEVQLGLVDLLRRRFVGAEVELETLHFSSHSDCAVPALISGISWFDSLATLPY